MIENNFTWLDWKIGTKLLKGENDNYTIENLSHRLVARLANNIFPGGNTFLHQLFRYN